MARILLELEGQDKGAKAAVDKLRQELAELDRATDSVDFKQLTEEIARAGGDFRSVSGEIDGYIGRLRAATPENAKTAASFAAVVQAFEKGEISADQAADELERLRGQMKKTGQTADQTKKEFGSFASQLDDAVQSVTGFSLAQVTLAGGLGLVASQVKSAIGDYSAYVEQVDKLTMSTGMSAEEMSRLAQVADDFRVDINSLEGALGMALKNGFNPTTENLASLADELRGISDPTQKAERLTEIFGRQWEAVIPLLDRGGQAIREASAGISDSLIVTEDAIEANRSFQKSLDDLQDTWTGIKNEFAKGLLTEGNLKSLELFASNLEDLNNGVSIFKILADNQKAYTRIEMEATNAAMNYTAAEDRAREAAKKNAAAIQESGQAHVETASSVDRYKQAIDEAGQSAANATGQAEAHAKALMTAYDELRSATSSGGFGSMNEDFAQTQADIRAEITETAAKLEEVERRQPWKTDEIQGYKDKLAELDTKLVETADAHTEAMHRMAYDMIAQRAAADGMTENELANLTTLAQSWGLYDETTAAVIQAINKNLGSLDTSGPEAMQSAIAGILNLPDSKTITVETKMEGGTEVADGASPEEIEARFMSAAQTGAAAMGELGGAAAEAQTAIGDTSGIDQFAAAVDQAPAAAETFKTGVNVIVEETLPVFNESIMEAWELVDKLVSRLEDFARTWEATVRVRGEGEIPGGTPIDNSYGDLEDDEEDFQHAAGGRIGSPSWVGETGPEIFAPDTPGYVLNRGDAMSAVRESVRSDIWRAAMTGGMAGGSTVNQSAETNLSFGQVILPNVTNTREFMAELYRLARRGAAAGVGYAGG